ncbi:MAG: hypothetical protein FJ318_05430 [SAR202 cluster bacterium]|nr:hypothetical protein [SAR202 cluster bacterium]
MGQLIERLERTTRGYAKPFGFGAAAKREKIPPMLLLGAVALGSDADARKAAEAGLDGAVVAAKGAGKKADAEKSAKALKEQTWGLWLDEPQKEAPGETDFQVFSSDGTPIAVLGGEGRTAFMQVNPDLDDSLLRTIDDLPVDGFLVSLADASALTVRQLMRIARVRGVTSKWLLVHVTQPPSQDELGRLRDAGVNAVVVDVAGHGAEALKACREALLELPKKEDKRKNGAVATLPPMRQAASPSRRTAEPEPDDDDDGGGDLPL